MIFHNLKKIVFSYAPPKIRDGHVGFKFVFEASKDLGSKGKVSFTVEIEIYVHPGGFGIPDKTMSDAFAATPNYVSQLNVNLDEVKQGLVTISVLAGLVAVAVVLAA